MTFHVQTAEMRGNACGNSGNWRREWDSNPRYALTHTRFPSVRLKPLGHPSGAADKITAEAAETSRVLSRLDALDFGQCRAYLYQKARTSAPAPARERNTTMAWTRPTIREICIGMEINGYLPAEI